MYDTKLSLSANEKYLIPQQSNFNPNFSKIKIFFPVDMMIYYLFINFLATFNYVSINNNNNKNLCIYNSEKTKLLICKYFITTRSLW